MRPQGVSSSVDLIGHPTASPETRQGLRPLSFAAKREEGKKGQKNESSKSGVQGDLVDCQDPDITFDLGMEMVKGERKRSWN